MEENTCGKKKILPSIPANYISILQLQERWFNEKEEQKKRKEEEEEERRRKLQVDEEKKIQEENLKKADKEKRLDRSNRNHIGRNSRNKDGGEASLGEKEKSEVTAAIGKNGGGEDDAAEKLPKKKKNKGSSRKRYDNSKKKNINQYADVLDSGGGSIAPPPECNTPVKDIVRVHMKKKTAEYRKKPMTDYAATTTAIENLFIKNVKAQSKPSNRNLPKQEKALEHHHQRIRMPRGASASTMVWVKKEAIERGGGDW